MRSDGGGGGVADGYLDQVMAEIDDEARRRRKDLPARVERELDELFLAHSPVAGRGGAMGDALRMVDAAAFIDPVVPVASNKSGGAVLKKGLRTLNLWYIGYVTHQVSQFATAVSRALHLVDEHVSALRAELPLEAPAPVLDSGGPGAWWVPHAVDACSGAAGRVLHAACGTGWLVGQLADKGVDAYGVDPRPGRTDDAELAGSDLRQEPVMDHLRAVAPSALGGVVLAGVVEGMAYGQRQALLDLLADRLSPDGVLVVHSLSPAAWAAADAPFEADLAPGRPLRASTWAHLLSGFSVQVEEGPSGADYLVVARR